MPIFPNWPGPRQADATRILMRGYRGISVTAILASTLTLLSVATFSAGTRADAAISAATAPVTAVTVTRHAHARKHTPAKHRHAPVRHHAPAKHHAPVRHQAKLPSALALARRGQWTLRIPGIDVATRLLVLGDPRGGQLPVPTLAQARDAAWYPFTAVPGTPGNAVIVGHVDTYTGPGVFYDLYLLRPGDKIYVRIGSSQEDFKVTSVTEVPKTLFPVSKIFGGTRSRRLWLITCGGDFDYVTRHYLDNMLVSSDLIGEASLRGSGANSAPKRIATH